MSFERPSSVLEEPKAELQNKEGELGSLQKEYNRDIGEDFLRDLEDLVGRVPYLKERVYAITDLLSKKDIDQEYYNGLVRDGLKEKHKDLNEEELRILTELYKRKLEDLCDRAISYNNSQ